MKSLSHLSEETRQRILEVCEQFRQTEPADRDIDAACQGFEGDAAEALRDALVEFDLESRFASEVDQEMLDAVPSGFLKGSFQDLLAQDDPGQPSSPRYEIGPSVGIGGIGEVYRVFDNFSQRPLALKTLQRKFLGDTSAINRFLREGLLTGTLQHPGIPPVYDHGRLDDGTPFFSMKLIEGETFHKILKTRASRSDGLGELIGIFQSVAQTLAYVHCREVVHRDLKPQNVMVGQFGEVQVMDWGLAKQLGKDVIIIDETDTPTTTTATREQEESDHAVDLDETPNRSDLTTAGDIVGTPGYMSPEQARGEVNSIDARTDVFALGAMLYEILTGDMIFAGESAMSIVEKTRSGDLGKAIERLDRHDGDSELVSLCRRCLSTDRSDRPENAGVVAAATADYLSGFERRMRQAELERTRAQVRDVESRKRQRWIIGLTTAIAAIGIISALLIAMKWREATGAAIAESLAREQAEKETKTANEINHYLDGILSSGLPDRRGPAVTFKEVIDEAVPQLQGKFVDRPLVEGKIRRTLGESYRWLGQPDRAEEQLRWSLDAFSKVDSIEEAEILDTKDALAGVLRSRGGSDDLDESEQLRTEVLRRTIELFGADDPRTVIALNNLGIVHLEQNRLDDAESRFRDALATIDAQPQFDDVERALLLLNLADIDNARDRFDSAESTYLRIIDDPAVPARRRADALVQLGEMLQRTERYDDSIGYLERAFDARETVFGPLHPLTLSALRKRTRAMEAGGRHQQLMPLLDESIAKHTEADRPAAGTVCEARSLMAKSLIALGRNDEAESYIEATIELISSERGEDHPYAERARQQLDELRSR